ncbi:hypothetical protein M1D72_20985 [Vibrio sp. AK197]
MIQSKFPLLDIDLLNSPNLFKNYLNYKKFISHHNIEKLEGDTWFILSCGPSLNIFDKDEQFQSLLEKHPVITIKQAGEIYSNVSNFHLFNEVRYNSVFNEIGNYRFSVSEYQKNSLSHIHFPIRSYKRSSALFLTNQYEKNELSKRFLRPWGVGIFFELAIFLPVLFKCKNIVLCGVDMNSKGNYHFYDKNNEDHAISYNVDEFEFFFTKGTSYYLEYWLKTKGINVFNLSPMSEMPITKVNTVSELKKKLNETSNINI